MRIPFSLVAAAAALMLMAGAGAAFAHAKMTGSVPKDGATVAAGLAQIEMTFSHPMRLTLLRVHRSADDRDVPLNGVLAKTFAQSAKVGIDALTAGAYDVAWTAVSEDGHVMRGRFAFTVADPPDAAPPQ